MQNSQKTAGETAPRTLVIFRDCHAKNNLVIHIEDHYEERFYRNYARRMGWPCTIRKASAEAVAQQAATAVHNWRKPAAIIERPRPQLGGAFKLALTSLSKGGCLS